MRASTLHIQGTHTPRSSKHASASMIPFELIREQLQQFTPQQLRALRGAIDEKLEFSDESIITEEEHQMIATLFS